MPQVVYGGVDVGPHGVGAVANPARPPYLGEWTDVLYLAEWGPVQNAASSARQPLNPREVFDVGELLTKRLHCLRASVIM